jgi:hypothetical protein
MKVTNDNGFSNGFKPNGISYSDSSHHYALMVASASIKDKQPEALRLD